jgi:triosephosphate isomerase
MKKALIVANWKSNKTILQAEEWFQRLQIKDLRLTNKELVICPSFTSLPLLNSLIINHKSSMSLGAQDISPFDEGAYTGEISAKQIKEFADYVIIGHSERRINFNESDEMLFKKVDLAIQHGLTPIFCVQGKETQIPSGITMIAYEPINAIGTGHPDTPENAQEMASFFKKIYNVQCVLYGGSVVSGNVKEFTQMSNIDGVLVGGASLDAQEFYKIIQNA